MPILTVKLSGKDRHITFMSGRSVRDVLDEADIRVRTGCNGTGACGLCRIRIAGGNVDEPSLNELASLGTGLLSHGVRLACEVKADHDLQIEILNPAPTSVWRYLNEGASTAYFPSTPRIPYTRFREPLGVAIDLGTTHISITLLDLIAGRRLSGRRGPNPQVSSGSDVLTRLIAAKSVDQAEKLSRQVIQAIADGLRDISCREGIDLRQVTRVVLVGNTAMLSLLTGNNYLRLLEPRYWTESIDCLPTETDSWGASWGINPGTTIEVIPPLAGFVGSDLLSGIVATRLMEQGPGALLIDFGTNSEMVLWDGNNLWVTSAAGGPAFEGSGISCGMPAEPGAICRVTVSHAPGELAFEVIAGVEARGLCGSGLLDLLAFLVRNGTLNNKGQFAPSVPEYGFPLCRNNREIVLTKKDIDMFQRAKAAVGVGVEILLSKAGMGYHELRRIFIGGVFGQYLNVVSAQELGLLPSISEQMIVTAGNTALSGCEALLFLPKAEDRLREIRSRAMIVNLSDYTDFNTLFLEHLYLRRVAMV